MILKSVKINLVITILYLLLRIYQYRPDKNKKETKRINKRQIIQIILKIMHRT
jgi:hypothetical protein